MTIKLYDNNECTLLFWPNIRKLYFKVGGRTYDIDVPYGRELSINHVNAIYKVICTKI